MDDRPQPCPYFPERSARLWFRLPLEALSPGQLDERLAEGDRRWGRFLYRPACEGCRACEPLRIDVARFSARRFQRRARARGDAALTTDIGSPVLDAARLTLFEAHRNRRGLSEGDHATSLEEYRTFIVDSCAQTLEFRYRLAGRLAGVAIADRGSESLSAVYCYFDPGVVGFGVGTYSILRQIEFCRREGLRWLYLGYFIAGHPHMAYKSQFRPHQRLIEGAWRDFGPSEERPAT